MRVLQVLEDDYKYLLEQNRKLKEEVLWLRKRFYPAPVNESANEECCRRLEALMEGKVSERGKFHGPQLGEVKRA